MPVAIFLLITLVVLMAIVAHFTDKHSYLRPALAVVVCGVLAYYAFDSALYVSKETFSGGIPLLSLDSNILMARIIFYAGGVCCLLLLCLAARDAVLRFRHPKKR